MLAGMFNISTIQELSVKVQFFKTENTVEALVFVDVS